MPRPSVRRPLGGRSDASNPYPNLVGHYHGLGISAVSAVMSVDKPKAGKPGHWPTNNPQWRKLGDWLKN